MAEFTETKEFENALKNAELRHGMRFNSRIGHYERFLDCNKNSRKLYASPDEAAREWSKVHNNESKRLNRELATYIYKDSLDNHYVPPHYLIASESGFLLSDLNKIAERDGCSLGDIVAVAHTHGNDDSRYETDFFSETEDDGNGDIPLSRQMGVPIFLITPNGNFMKYDPKTDEITWPDDYLP